MKILVLPGDGIGPEITDATLAVRDRANAKFKLDFYANIRGSLARARQSAPAEPTGSATNC